MSQKHNPELMKLPKLEYEQSEKDVALISRSDLSPESSAKLSYVLARL